MGPICILTSLYLDQKGNKVFKWGMITTGDRHTWSGDHLPTKNKAVGPGLILFESLLYCHLRRGESSPLSVHPCCEQSLTSCLVSVCSEQNKRVLLSP